MNVAVCQWPWISMGEIYLAPLGPFSVSTLIPGLLSFWRAYGSFSDQWDKIRQQWPHWTSIPFARLCALNPPGLPFLLPTFLLNSKWMNTLLSSASFASSLPLACSHCAVEYFLFILLSGGSSLKQYFASFFFNENQRTHLLTKKFSQFSSVAQCIQLLWPHGLQHTRLPYFASSLVMAYKTGGFWILSNQTLTIQRGKMWSLENVNLSKLCIFF